MEQLTVTLTGAVISGSFAVLAACAPHYLESRKQRQLNSKKIFNGEHCHYPLWNLLLGIAFPLVFYFLFTSLALFYGFFGICIAASQTPDPASFLSSIDIVKAADISRLLGKVELFFLGPIMFIVFLYTSRYIFYRSGQKAILSIIISAIIIWSTDIAIEISYQNAALPMIDIIRNSIVFGFAYVISAIIGIRWAKKTYNRFMFLYLFNRLKKQDKEALFDLAKNVVSGSNNQE